MGSEQTTETGNLKCDKGLRIDQTQKRELILEDGCWKGCEVMLTTTSIKKKRRSKANSGNYLFAFNTLKKKTKKQGEEEEEETHWKNLKALMEAPQLENNTRSSSSTTEGLKHKHPQVRVWQQSGHSAALLPDHLRDVGQVERG